MAILCLIALGLAACSSPPLASPIPTSTSTQAGTLTPYQTATQTPTITLTATPRFSITPTPTISPTAVTYKVRSEDDMYGIAFRFGISPQALMTANPKVNPRAMSIGTILIIPVTPHPPQVQVTSTPLPPTPTPIVAILQPPVCYPALDGGIWCFLLVKNVSTQGLENLAGLIQLASSQDAAPLTQPAAAPLDLLPPGASLPLVAYFPPPAPAYSSVSGQITQTLPQPKDDNRYLTATVLNQQITISSTGQSVSVSGQVSLPEKSQPARLIRLAAIAYSADGAVAGLRQWESSEPLAAASPRSFNLEIYSLGPTIDHVTVLVEARP